MGVYLNPGRRRLEISMASDIYVDKSEMICYLNTVVNTNQRYVCVSRPRRFGKTMAADMLSAYYDREAGSRQIFEKMKLSDQREWDSCLGKFDVIRLVMTDFFSQMRSVDQGLERLQKLVMREIKQKYPEVDYFDPEDLLQSIQG